MFTPIHLEPKLVPSALRGAYAGKKFKAYVTESVTIPASAGLWEGGSRDTYRLADIATGETVPASDNASAPWDPRKDRTIALKPGYVVIRHSIHSGRDAGLTFFVHPQNATALLPAPAAELSPHEALVLEATASLKSSYGGKDRYEMSREDVAYGAPEKRDAFPTRDQWDAAKASLIARGYLNKAGAITVAGRNARPKKY